MLRKGWAALAVAVMVSMAGCKNSGHDQNSADMRALNAVVDAEPLDFLIDDNVKAGALALGTASGYSEFGSGSRDVKIRSASSQSVLVDKSVSFNSGSNTTLIAYGKRAAITTLLLTDDTTEPSSGHMKVRALGLSGDAGAVDVYLATGDVSLAAATVSSVTLGAATDYSEISPGTYSIVMTTAGTKEILFQSAPQTFAAGTKLTVAVFPAGGGKLVNALLLTPSPSAVLLTNPQARVKAVNAVPDSTTLTFKSDGAALLSSVPFAAASSYVFTAAGARTLQLEASNVPGTAIATLARTLDPARDYTMLALNRLGQVQLTAFADDNTFPASGFARVRFANAMVDGATVDVLVNFASQTAGLAYANASSYYLLAAATDYTITFATPGGIQAIATLSPVELGAGLVYTVYLLGTSSAPVAKLVRDR